MKVGQDGSSARSFQFLVMDDVNSSFLDILCIEGPNALIIGLCPEQ